MASGAICPGRRVANDQNPINVLLQLKNGFIHLEALKKEL